MSEHKLTDILGIESLPTPVVPSESDIVMVPAPTDHTVETDATYARENIRNLIKVSGPAL